MQNKSPILLHIPHSSMRIPKNYRPLFYLQGNYLEQELLNMTDRYTDELFSTQEASRLVFPISRMVCDVERFRCDTQEEMSKIGMGVCYEKTSKQTPLKTVTTEHRREILEEYYDKHHQKLWQITQEKMDIYGKALILDCHSFASRPLPYEAYQENRRPDICIGSDAFHTPQAMVDFANAFFRQRGYSVAENYPYCGTIVPMAFYRKHKNVQSLMLEINRKKYMDETNGEKTDNFLTLQGVLQEFIGELKRRFI